MIGNFRKLFSQRKGNSLKECRFVRDLDIGVAKRSYTSYAEYLDHQRKKLQMKRESIREYDCEYEAIVRSRYASICDWRSKSILCLAARLGGEVRAFRSLGALSIGIDIEPGPGNPYVLHGDFHAIQFAEESFDAAFTNAIDHVYDLQRFAQEVNRILKKRGVFYVELAEVTPGEYEVLDTTDVNPIIAQLKRCFDLEGQSELTNRTQFVQWRGLLLQLRKKSS